MPKYSADNCANTSPVTVHSTGAEVNSVTVEEARRTIDEAGLIMPKDMCRIQLTTKMAINTVYTRTIKLSSTRKRNNLAHNNNVAGSNTLKIFNKSLHFRYDASIRNCITAKLYQNHFHLCA